MARSYKYTKGDKKIPTGYLVSFLSWGWRDERGAKKIKNGIYQEEIDSMRRYVGGTYTTGVPKSFRKKLVRQKRSQLKQELRNARAQGGDYDNIEKTVEKRTAGWYYY